MGAEKAYIIASRNALVSRLQFLNIVLPLKDHIDLAYILHSLHESFQTQTASIFFINQESFIMAAQGVQQGLHISVSAGLLSMLTEQLLKIY